MIKKGYENFTLCTNNSFVRDSLIQIRKILKKNNTNCEEVEKLISESKEILLCMKKQGQRLENRCRKYRRAIESCGFQRIENK